MKREPGFYAGLSMVEYLATHAVSASIVSTIDQQCPRAAWHDSWLNPGRVIDLSSRAQSVGTIAHGILLEGSTKNVAVIDPCEYPTKTTGNIPDGWTNKDIRAARDVAIAEGKTPILKPQFAVVDAMVGRAFEYIESLKSTEPAIYALFQPAGGDSEATIVWEDVDGIPCRIRPDRIAKDRRIIVDYKTVTRTAEPNAFGRQVSSMGYDVSAAFYRRGVHKLFGHEPEYVFLVQEQEAPHLCSLVGLEPAWLDFGKRKVASGLATWSSCARTGVWPAYPTRVCYLEIPPWEAARHEEREAVRGNPYEIEQLWQKPEKLGGFEAERAPAVGD